MVKIEFETDNASMRDGEDGLDLWEVSDIIKAVADRIHEGYTNGTVGDLNGNTIGHYSVE